MKYYKKFLELCKIYDSDKMQFAKNSYSAHSI